jgi:hypothetical protein
MNNQTDWGKLRHTSIEGALYFCMAALAAIQTDLGSEESYKYMNPQWRFWIILTIGALLTGFNALKAFRSMTFGRAYGSPTPDPQQIVVPVQPEPVKVTTEAKVPEAPKTNP